MKIAILFNGLVRPTNKAFFDNRNLLFNSFWDNGEFEIETFLFSWFTEHSKDSVYEEYADNYILLNEPSREYTRDVFKGKYIGVVEDEYRICNHFKQFWRNKISIEFLQSHYNKYDYVVYSRPDLKIEFNPNDGWLDPDSYCMPGPEQCNDQFGIATLENLYKVWNYRDIDILSTLISQNVNPEHTMCSIARMNSAKIKLLNPRTRELIRGTND